METKKHQIIDKICQSIKPLRETRELSQAELAEKSGVSITAIIALENAPDKETVYINRAIQAIYCLESLGATLSVEAIEPLCLYRCNTIETADEVYEYLWKQYKMHEFYIAEKKIINPETGNEKAHAMTYEVRVGLSKLPLDSFGKEYFANIRKAILAERSKNK